jgi:calcyclin binding protein
MSEFGGEIAEVESLLASATFPGVKSVLQTHLSMLQRKEAARVKKEAEMDVDAPEPASSSAPTVPRSAPTTGAYVPLDDFAWDQGEYNSATVSVFVDLEGVGKVKDKVEVNFTKTTFDMKVHGLNGKNYRLLKDNLEKDIVPSESKFIVKANKVVLKLKKIKGEYSYEHWASLSAKKKREPGEVKSKDPMGGIMDMMKDMYDDGNEDMKKVIGEAMMKSKMGEKQDALPDMNNMSY